MSTQAIAVSNPVIHGPVNFLAVIANQLERYLFLKDKALYRFLAAWIIGTYLAVDHFDYFGYLLFTSPGPACGKTRALELLRELCWQPTGILADPTKAVIFNTANCSTQLLDEIDSWPDKTDLRSVLNEGAERGGVVLRMWKDKNGNFGEVRTIPVFGPKALAGINKNLPLSGVTRTRVFEIGMLPQLKTQRRERFNRKARESLAFCVRAIRDWVEENRQRIVEVYETSGFSYLDNFGDRTIDFCRPIAAIYEVACELARGDSNEVRRELLRVIPIVRPSESCDNSLIVLSKLRELLSDGETTLIGSAHELADKINPNLVEPLTDYEIGEALRRFGFKTKNIRVDGGNPAHRYSIPVAELDDLLVRFQ